MKQEWFRPLLRLMNGGDTLSLLRILQERLSSCLATAPVLGVCVSLAASPVLAQTAAGSSVEAESTEAAGAEALEIELNRLEQRDGACRLSFVYRNRLGTDLDALQIEAVLFDQDERVERFLVLSSKSLPSDKIRVQQFDISGLDCTGLGSILVNDVKACEGKGLDPEACLARLSLSSKAEAGLLSSVGQ